MNHQHVWETWPDGQVRCFECDAKAHGGPRDGAGRKPLSGTRPIMKSVKLSQEHWDLARAIGGGNMAEGLRRALDAYPAT